MTLSGFGVAQLQATPNPLKVNPKPAQQQPGCQPFASPTSTPNHPKTHPHEDLSQPTPPPPATPNCHPIRANRQPQVQVSQPANQPTNQPSRAKGGPGLGGRKEEFPPPPPPPANKAQKHKLKQGFLCFRGCFRCSS